MNFFQFALPTLIGAFVMLLLRAQYYQQQKNALIFKSIASSGFILLAFMFFNPQSFYHQMLFIGLTLGLFGDVLLALEGKTTVTLGIIAFLIGHFFYASAFLALNTSALSLWPYGILLLLSFLFIAFIFIKKLHSKKALVIGYLLIIHGMLYSAFLSFQGNETHFGYQLLLLGSVMFALSDIFVARNRFMKKEFKNRLWGLPLYYTAQTMLAFTLMLFPE